VPDDGSLLVTDHTFLSKSRFLEFLFSLTYDFFMLNPSTVLYQALLVPWIWFPGFCHPYLATSRFLPVPI
jgi:hypothetical protein